MATKTALRNGKELLLDHEWTKKMDSAVVLQKFGRLEVADRE
jgi:hypothetical protein